MAFSQAKQLLTDAIDGCTLRTTEGEDNEEVQQQPVDSAQPKMEKMETIVTLPSTHKDKTRSRSDKARDRRERDRKEKKEKRGKRKDSYKSESRDDNHCIYCNLDFTSKTEFQLHVRSEEHSRVVMSDEGRLWRYRQPPRGLTAESYTLCKEWQQTAVCKLGERCSEAHSNAELIEWRTRFEYRQNKAKSAANKYGTCYIEKVLDQLVGASRPEGIMSDSIPGVACMSDKDTQVTVEEKVCETSWEFSLTSNRILHTVALLQHEHRQHFVIEDIKHIGLDGTNASVIVKTFNCPYNQEWSHPELRRFLSCASHEYKVRLKFNTDIFGTFRQTILFDFGSQPLLSRAVCVDVLPVSQAVALKSIRETILSTADKWDSTNSDMIKFEPPLNIDNVEDEAILKKYPAPQPSKFKIAESVLQPRLTETNYKQRMHQLLYIEEMAQFSQLAAYNVTTRLRLTTRYLLTPTSTSSSTAKYARPGEIFGRMKLDADLSEDTQAGRLILTKCNTVLLSPVLTKGKSKVTSKTDQKIENGDYELASQDNVTDLDLGKNQKPKVWECVIEDTGKSVLYVRLPTSLVTAMNLISDTDLKTEVQFQLNRLPMAEMHHALDRLQNLYMVYPLITKEKEQPIPWNPGKQWDESLDSRLNPKQREAILAITASVTISLPPILIIGPYGTGKTFTLGQAVRLLLKQPKTRVLVCTHSNSAADLYIHDYLDPAVQEGSCTTLPLRVYYRNRWVQTVHPVVQKYCLIDSDPASNLRYFRVPTENDLEDRHVIVTTLATSRCLADLNLPVGYFTHILVDEAAQAIETEAIMPLVLAGPNTRVVLAGDHMQLSPEVISTFAKEKKLDISLLERLYDLYPSSFSCKILLCENYRSHEAIINYTSELFYDQKLVGSAKQPKHDTWYPLTFFTARGEDIQDTNSTSFYNNSEVYEIVERVAELQKSWPKGWGVRNDTSIGVVTPYYDQVQRIRSELRKRKLFGVSVERVLNVQGKQFRAIFLSTVRTRRTCQTGSQESNADIDYGFLSNAKLLNTAITRAQSLVAVIGDPVAICTVGKCRKLWEKFLEICNQNTSIFGITWSSFRSQLDGIEFKKTFVFNPLAPEFVPRRQQQVDTWINMIQPQDHFLTQYPQFGISGGMFPPFPPTLLTNPRLPPMPYMNPLAVMPPPTASWISGGHMLPRGPSPPTSTLPRFPFWDSRPPAVIPRPPPIAPNVFRPVRFPRATFPPPPPPPPPLMSLSIPPPFTTLSDPFFSAKQINSPLNAITQKIDPSTFLTPPRIRSNSTGVRPQHPIPRPADILPQGITLAAMLASAQMQQVWYDHLLTNKGLAEAQAFRDLIVTSAANAAANVAANIVSQPPPQPILAEQLEAEMLQEVQPQHRFPDIFSSPWNKPEPLIEQKPIKPAIRSPDSGLAESTDTPPPDGLTDLLQSLFLSDSTDVLSSDTVWPGLQNLLNSNGTPSPNVPLYMKKSQHTLEEVPVEPQTQELITPKLSIPNDSPAHLQSSLGLSEPQMPEQRRNLTDEMIERMTAPDIPQVSQQQQAESQGTRNLTYAGVLRSQQDKETTDPLTRIRLLGTRGSQILDTDPNQQGGNKRFGFYSQW